MVQIDDKKFLQSMIQIRKFDMLFPLKNVLETFFECCGDEKIIAERKAREMVDREIWRITNNG